MSNIIITSFNSGEVSPHLDARSDVAKYASSCRTLENMLPLVYGDVERRPGTKYVANAKSSAAAIRLIPFIYSATLAYVCEFGDYYIRFFYNAAPVATEIVSPYAVADLPSLQYRQIGDTMWLVHPDYAPRKLTRTSATTFAINTIDFIKGPFLTRNDLDTTDGLPGVTLTCSVTAKGATGTLTSSAPLFTADHVGSIWKLIHHRDNTVVTLRKSPGGTGVSSPLLVKGSFVFDTHLNWTGTIVIERSENGGLTWDTYRTYQAAGDKNISLAATEPEDDIYYRINMTIHPSGNLWAELAVDSSVQEGVVRVDSFSSALVANVTILSPLASTSATLRWAEGSWSTERGFPGAVAFFEGRIVYAGTDHDPQTVWFSATDDFEDFAEDVKDADSFALTLASTNRIRWIEALEALAVGTSGDEWRVSSTRLEQAITPTNFNAKEQTTFGSAAVQPVKINMTVLFLDYVSRKIREFTFGADEQRYVAPDLTQLAEHVTLGGVTAMAHQKSPDSILWCVANGGLISLTYERDQDVVAWARHPMTGATVESVAVIPGTTEDEVYLATIRGGVRMIERMAPRAFTLQADAYFVDCGVAYTGAATVFTGLDHLEGQTVSILGDGAVFPAAVVVNGQVTLDTSVSKCAIGLSYRYTVKPMRIETHTQAGTSHGSAAAITEVVVSFYRSLDVQYGVDLTHLFELDWRTTEDYDDPPALFTGDRILTLDGGWDSETPIILTGIDPLPCTIRCIVARVEFSGR